MVVATVLAVLGVPLWLVVGMLVAALWNRRRFLKNPGVFSTKLRLEAGSFAGLGDRWPRVSAYATWVHDVLLINKGLALIRTMPLPIAAGEGIARDADPSKVKRMGDSPVLLRFRLDNGAILQMAVPRDARLLALGPYAPVESRQDEPRVMPARPRKRRTDEV